MAPELPWWEELREQEQQYVRLLELRCELLQREVEHLRQQLTQHLVSSPNRALADIGQLQTTSTPEELLQRARSLLQRWTQATDVYTLRLAPDGTLQVHPPLYAEHARMLAEEGVIDWLTEHGRPTLLPDLFRGSESAGLLLLLPLGQSGQRFGTLVALNVPATLPLTELHEQLQYIGLVLGLLLDNAESTRTATLLHEQLQQLQRALQQSEAIATLGKMTSIVIHELSNPLQALLSYAELLEAGVGNPRSHARSLQRELLRLNHLLDELRHMLRRPDASPQQLPVDVTTAIERALELLHVQFQRDRITVRLEHQAPATRILGTPDQLEQVFVNLFLNARDAMPEGGLLHIRLRTEGQELVVECQDTGRGIPPELLERVLEPFFTTKPHGSGLGLTLCRDIVERHGGTLSLHSQPGAGTTAILRFPLLQDVPQAATSSPCG